MIRLLVVFVVLFALALGAAWVADHPGDIVVEWLGYRIETSFALAALAALLAVLALLVVLRLLRLLLAGPSAVLEARSGRRRRRGYRALTQGLVAVAAGDGREAAKLAKRAEHLLEEPSLTLLLSAQAAQLADDDAAARRYFGAMLERPETEFLGVRGLLAQAIRDGDHEAALRLARRAYELKPQARWVLKARFDLETEAGHWLEAERVAEQAVKTKLIDAGEGRRRRALALYGQAQTAAEESPSRALDLARKAHELASDFVPAAVLTAELFHRTGKTRRAVKAIESAWGRAAHPALADAYLAVDGEAGAGERFKRIRRLAAQNAEHPESRVALAAAALEAEDWEAAHRVLEPALEDGDARVFRLMAELAERAEGDTRAARDWLLRASLVRPEPTWLCRRCGRPSPEWQARCEGCDAFDSIVWASPPRAEAPPLGLAHDEAPEATAPEATAPEATAPEATAEVTSVETAVPTLAPAAAEESAAAQETDQEAPAAAPTAPAETPEKEKEDGKGEAKDEEEEPVTLPPPPDVPAVEPPAPALRSGPRRP